MVNGVTIKTVGSGKMIHYFPINAVTAELEQEIMGWDKLQWTTRM
jgi:hypothetical protein